MTTEERELVERLRQFGPYNPEANPPCLAAASLIERITKERDDAREKQAELNLQWAQYLTEAHSRREHAEALLARTSREFYEYALKMEGKK